MERELCRLSDLPVEGARGFELEQARLLAVITRGSIHVYLNRCPHLGVPLHWQADRFLDEEGVFIRCANHGALFEKDTGLCIQGPCRGDSLWRIECRVEHERVLIDDAELPVKVARMD